MKILHVTNSDVTNDNRIHKQIKFLNSQNHFFVSSIFIKSERYNCKNEVAGVKNVSRKFTLSKHKWIPRTFRHVCNMLELTFFIIIKGSKIKPDIIHAHDTLVLPAATLLSIFCKSKLIYDAHELESKRNGQNILMSYGSLLIEKICWKRINKFITVSDSILNWYFKKFSTKDFEIILNSPINQKLKKTDYLRDKFLIKKNSNVFIYIGYLSKGRGINHILDAFSQTDDSNHIVFLGEGELEEQIKTYSNLNTNIHHHTSVKYDNVIKIASSANVGICLIENTCLSYYFALPNKLFEYIFSGLKVIGSDFPEIKKVITKCNAGITCKSNVISLLEAINKIDLKQETVNLESLSWKYQEKKLLNLYTR